MTDPEPLLLAGRITASAPERLRIVSEFRGPVRFFDPGVGFAGISYLQRDIYSLNCLTGVLLPRRGLGKKPEVINDLRLSELAIDLIEAAIQNKHANKTRMMRLLLSRLAIEQSLSFPIPALHAGLLLDHLALEAVEEAAATAEERRHQVLAPEEMVVLLERLTQFSLVHEVTHYCFFADGKFREDWLAHARKMLPVLRPAASSDGFDDFLATAIRRRTEDLARCDSHQLSRFPDLEETLCDLSAVASLIEALTRANGLSGSLTRLFIAIDATITASWLAATMRGALEALFNGGTINLQQTHTILTDRGGLALLSAAQGVGLAQRLDAQTTRELVRAAWQDHPDFETMAVTALNEMFIGPNLHRLLAAGQMALDTGLCTPVSAEDAALRQFGWKSRIDKSN